MQTIKEFPLFRTASQTPVGVPVRAANDGGADAVAVVVEAIGDLTDYVGETVDQATWTALLQRLTLPDYEGWTFTGEVVADGVHIARLHMAALADEEDGQWSTSDFESFGF